MDRPSALPNTFKAIALFTPGGDLVYGVAPNQQAQWHSDLCLAVQKHWGLANSPHFLVPGYTATVERWFNPQLQQVVTIAEAFPPVERYIPLLQSLFNLDTTQWQISPWQEEYCNRAVIETYKSYFPQLWEQQDLILRCDPKSALTMNSTATETDDEANLNPRTQSAEHNNVYGLQLFVSGDRQTTEITLSSIHQLLERDLGNSYTLKVIDIDQNPQQAVKHQIVATPTLIRVSPKPVKRIVGRLNDIQRVLRILTKPHSH